MGKLYKLRRDIRKNPTKYVGSRFWPVRGASFNRCGEIYTGPWSKGYGGFIRKVLKELKDEVL